MRQYKVYRITPIIIALSLVTACSATTDPTRFYSLKSTHTVGTIKNIAEKTYSLSIESISIPRLLDRPQIVSRIGENEIKRSEFHQWGGSVVEEIQQLFTKNLEIELSNTHFYLLTRESRLRPDYTLYLNITRLDGELGNYATVEITWLLESVENGEITNRGTILQTTPLATKRYSDYIATLQRLLEQSVSKLAEQLLTQPSH